MDKHTRRNKKARQIVDRLTDQGARVALIAILRGHSTLQALLMGQTFKNKKA